LVASKNGQASDGQWSLPRENMANFGNKHAVITHQENFNATILNRG